nr:unnamed protein product [Mus musculus]
MQGHLRSTHWALGTCRVISEAHTGHWGHAGSSQKHTLGARDVQGHLRSTQWVLGTCRVISEAHTRHWGHAESSQKHTLGARDRVRDSQSLLAQVHSCSVRKSHSPHLIFHYRCYNTDSLGNLA